MQGPRLSALFLGLLAASRHPFPVFNTPNACDWLIDIPLHNLRHDLQIAEVKAGAGYPK